MNRETRRRGMNRRQGRNGSLTAPELWGRDGLRPRRRSGNGRRTHHLPTATVLTIRAIFRRPELASDFLPNRYRQLRTNLGQNAAGPGTTPPIPALIRGNSLGAVFHQSNRTRIRVCRSGGPSLTRAFEAIAQELLPVANSIAAFTDIAEQYNFRVDDETVLMEIESEFGYSNWLAMEWLERFPSESEQRSRFLQMLRPGKRCFLQYWPVEQRFHLTAYAVPSTGVGEHLLRMGWRGPLLALLSLSLDPVPRLSQADLVSGLGICSGLPVIDKWMTLLKAAQCALIHHDLDIEQCPTTAALFQKVGSVESHRIIASSTESRSPVRSWDYLEIERELASLAGHTIAPTSEKARFPDLLNQVLSNRIMTEEASGYIAVLDRTALLLSGSRIGTIIASLVGQLSAFNDTRAAEHVRWFRLATNPDVDNWFPSSNPGRYFRMLGVPDECKEMVLTMMQTAEKGDLETLLSRNEQQFEPSKSAESLSLVVDLHIQNGSWKQVLSEAARLISLFPWMARRLPYREVLALLPNDAVCTDSAIAAAGAVVCDAGVRHGYSAAEVRRTDYVIDLLEEFDVHYPTDGEKRLTELVGPDVAGQFFNEVCTTDVMDTVPVGRSTVELLEERIRCLACALRLKSGGELAIEKEMKRVATTLGAMKAMAQLEHQRVYVDTIGLSSRLQNTLLDDFRRYRSFKALDKGGFDLTAVKQLLQESMPDFEVWDITELLRSLTTEADRAFLKLVLGVRHEFAVGHEFGLDGYLSGGIRHGVLESHLREPLVARRLLGKFHRGGTFTPPEICSQIEAVLPAQSGAVGYQTVFENLATEFQEIVDEVLLHWVRIDLDRSSDSKAIFDFSMLNSDVRYVETLTLESTNVESFIESCVDYYWSRVDSDLEEARERIRTDLDRRLRRVLLSFYSSLQVSAGEDGSVILTDLIGPCVGEMEATVAKLAHWFQRAESTEAGPVEFSMAVEIASRTVQAIYPDISFKWEFAPDENDPLLIEGRKLKHWVDILVELFKNAGDECGSETCIGSIEVQHFGTRLIISVSNTLGPAADLPSIDAGIQTSLKKLADPKQIRLVGQEGGTGLIKVWKYARVDLRSPSATVQIARAESLVTVSLGVGE